MNVKDRGDRRFETGYWKVSVSHAQTATMLALHESKSESSYRQGRIVSWRQENYNGSPRLVFIVESIREPMEWEGGGSGEKGYAWEN